jgi:hypothetical protein
MATVAFRVTGDQLYGIDGTPTGGNGYFRDTLTGQGSASQTWEVIWKNVVVDAQGEPTGFPASGDVSVRQLTSAPGDPPTYGPEFMGLSVVPRSVTPVGNQATEHFTLSGTGSIPGFGGGNQTVVSFDSAAFRTFTFPTNPANNEVFIRTGGPSDPIIVNPRPASGARAVAFQTRSGIGLVNENGARFLSVTNGTGTAQTWYARSGNVDVPIQVPPGQWFIPVTGIQAGRTYNFFTAPGGAGTRLGGGTASQQTLLQTAASVGDTPFDFGTPIYVAIPCFVAGSMILTPQGLRPVEDLLPGDLVTTRDHGVMPVRWVARSRLAAESLETDPRLCPIRIRAGALGEGLPRRDLRLSPQHRVLVAGRVVERMAKAPEALGPVSGLVGLRGVSVEPATEIVYVHLVLDTHAVVEAEGLAVETLLVSRRAEALLGDVALTAIRRVIGGTGDAAPCRPLLTAGQMRHLVRRSVKNGHGLLPDRASPERSSGRTG